MEDKERRLNECLTSDNFVIETKKFLEDEGNREWFMRQEYVDDVNMVYSHVGTVTRKRKKITSTGDRKDLWDWWEEYSGRLHAFHIACLLGDKDLSERLLAKNSDLMNLKAKDGSSPLCFACVSGNLDLVKLLVEKYSADVKYTDTWRSPLCCATDWRRYEVVEYLLEKRACPNKNGNLYVTDTKDGKIIKLLKDKGTLTARLDGDDEGNYTFKYNN